jgi:hypothetical protein
MKSMKIMGLCLVAAFLVSAVAVATASAAKPEFRFSNEESKKAFSSRSGAGILFAPTGGEIKCTSDTDLGEIEGASGTDKVNNVVVIFTGCTFKILGETWKCKTAGAPNAEEVRTNALEGQLGYINKPAKTVGLVLKPKAPNTVFATLECKTKAGTTTRKVEIKDEIIGAITPVNDLIEPGEHFTLTYKVENANKTVQVPNALEVLGTLFTGLLLQSNENGGAFANTGLETVDEIYPLQSTEISA